MRTCHEMHRRRRPGGARPPPPAPPPCLTSCSLGVALSTAHLQLLHTSTLDSRPWPLHARAPAPMQWGEGAYMVHACRQQPHFSDQPHPYAQVELPTTQELSRRPHERLHERNTSSHASTATPRVGRSPCHTASPAGQARAEDQKGRGRIDSHATPRHATPRRSPEEPCLSAHMHSAG